MTPNTEIIRLRAENSRLLAAALVREVDGLLDTAVTDLASTLIRDHGLEFIHGRPIFSAGGDFSDAVESARLNNPHYFSPPVQPAHANAPDPRTMSAAARLALANAVDN